MPGLFSAFCSVWIQYHILLCERWKVRSEPEDQKELSELSLQVVRSSGDENHLGPDRGGEEAEV